MSAHHVYRRTVPGVESLPPGLELPRHRHVRGYATVVLAGSFVEASFAGRFLAGPGEVLLHAAFDCHCNRGRSARGPQVLRLPWTDSVVEGHYAVADPDRLVHLAERDPEEATLALGEALRPIMAPASLHWTERLAVDLSSASHVGLREWAETEGIAPETVSRGFRRTFGVSPKLFRLEARARRAWRRLTHSRASLTTVAHELEFADLAHMSRSVAAFTGFAPSLWRHEGDGPNLLDQLRSSRARRTGASFAPGRPPEA